jgi:hypothetical protein
LTLADTKKKAEEAKLNKKEEKKDQNDKNNFKKPRDKQRGRKPKPTDDNLIDNSTVSVASSKKSVFDSHSKIAEIILKKATSYLGPETFKRQYMILECCLLYGITRSTALTFFEGENYPEAEQHIKSFY